MKRLFVFLLLIPACGWPINPDKMPEVLRELAKDSASGCFAIAGRGGGATVATPMPIVPGGVYGSGEVLFARANAGNTKVMLSINGATCTIERGPADAIMIPKLGTVTNFRVNKDGSTTIEGN